MRSGFADEGVCSPIEVSGEGFLYKMVRLMVGALVRVGREAERAGRDFAAFAGAGTGLRELADWWHRRTD